jgi:phosphopantetheinyl transferase
MIPSLVQIVASEEQWALAEAVLRPDERTTLAGFTFLKRRQDWLLGRLAGKLAVARGLGISQLERIGIRSEENGHPVAELDGAPIDGGWDLSLTHGHGRAAALLAPGQVGLDLERLREVPVGGWRFFLTPAEREWLAEGPLGPHGEIVAWALKEAAYKALQGRTRGMHHLTLEEVAEGRATLGNNGPEGSLAGRYEVGEGFCLAIATPSSNVHEWFDTLALAVADQNRGGDVWVFPPPNKA